MKCEEIKPLLTQYLLGDLDEARSAEVRAHIEKCGGCRAAVQEIEPTLDLLRDALAAPSAAPTSLSAEKRETIVRKVKNPARKLVFWMTTRHPRLTRVAAVFMVAFTLWIVSGRIVWFFVGDMFKDFGAEIPSLTSSPLSGPIGPFLPIFKMGEVVSGGAAAMIAPADQINLKMAPLEHSVDYVQPTVPVAPEETSQFFAYTGSGRTVAGKGGEARRKEPESGRGEEETRSAQVLTQARQSDGWEDGAGQKAETSEIIMGGKYGHAGKAVSAKKSAPAKGGYISGAVISGEASQAAPNSADYSDREMKEVNGTLTLDGAAPAGGQFAQVPAAPPAAVAPDAQAPVQDEKLFDLNATITRPKPLFIGTPVNMKNVRLDPAKKDGDQTPSQDLDALKANLRKTAENEASVDYFSRESGLKDGRGSDVSSVNATGFKDISVEQKPGRTTGLPLIGRLFEKARAPKTEAPSAKQQAEPMPEEASRSDSLQRLVEEVQVGQGADGAIISKSEVQYKKEKAKKDEENYKIGKGAYGPNDKVIAPEKDNEKRRNQAWGEDANQAQVEVAQEVVVTESVSGVGDDMDAPVDIAKSPLIMKGLYGNRTTVGREKALKSVGGGDVSEAARRSSESENDDRTVKDKAEERIVVSAGNMPVTTAQQPVSENKHEAKEEDKSGPRFKAYGVNPFVLSKDQPFSTFGIDCDTASYTLARNYMLKGYLPPAEAVRTEEFVNFFDYAYKAPERDTFKVYVECAPSKFGRGGLQMMKIGVKGRRLGREEQRQAVLTFLVDTSGSMEQPDRMGLVKKSLRLLVEKLNPQDIVSLVKYDSHAKLVLEKVPAAEKKKILDAIDSLQCTGSTNLEEGMQKAYQVAVRNFVSKGENRVLLMSDGVANLGETAAADILKNVEKYRKQGIFCSVFGVGIGTYNDEMLQELANKGDGTYKFIDSEAEARKVFVDDLAANLNTIAKNVKIQVEFNPNRISRYRQIGYERRQLKKEDFRNDTIDAGEVGSGQSVTALYETELKPQMNADERRYQNKENVIATVRVRYQRVDNGQIEEIERAVTGKDIAAQFDQADVRFRLAACAAQFAEILRGSPFAEGREFHDVSRVLAPIALEMSLDGRVQEFNKLVNGANGLSRGQ